MADDAREAAVQKWFNWYVGGGRGSYPEDGLRDVFRSGYDAGMEAAQAALAAARIEGAKAMQEAAETVCHKEGKKYSDNAKICNANGNNEGAKGDYRGATACHSCAMNIRALFPASISAQAKGGERG